MSTIIANGDKPSNPLSILLMFAQTFSVFLINFFPFFWFFGRGKLEGSMELGCHAKRLIVLGIVQYELTKGVGGST